MNSETWTDDEVADLELPFVEFYKRHPSRNHESYGRKKRRVRQDTLYPPKQRAVVTDQEETISDEELWDAVVRYQDALNAASPSNLHHHISLDTDAPIVLAFPSDWHIGNKGTDMKRLKADCELMESHPRVYVALGGDPVDNFIFEKMASAARSQVVGQIDIQWRLFRHRILKLYESNSLLWVSAGNHDAWTRKAAGIDNMLNVLSDIPVCYTGEGGFVHLTVGQQKYVIYRKHKPMSNSKINALLFLKNMLWRDAPVEFDIGVSEHLHKAAIETVEYRPGTKIDRVLIACGSYKVKDAYAEDLGYYGGGYGVPCVILYPDRRQILSFTSLSSAIEALDGVSTLAA